MVTKMMQHNNHSKSSFWILLIYLLYFFNINDQLVTVHSLEQHTSEDVNDDKASSSSPQNSQGWIIETYPNPTLDGAQCRTSPLHPTICDPDGVLDTESIDRIARRILSFNPSLSCNNNNNDNNNIPHDETQTTPKNENPIEIAIALMEKMDTNKFHIASEAAETYATTLHDTWGVGKQTLPPPCDQGSTGILLFFSMRDRVCYISTGKFFKAYLTERRLGVVISDDMAPLLRRGDVAGAIVAGLDRLEYFIEEGAPEYYWWGEEGGVVDWEFLVLGGYIGLMVVMGVMSRRQERERRREYAEVQSRLSRLDHDRALALQGRYQCTSCPICLEEFPRDTYQHQNSSTSNDNDNPTTTPSSQQHHTPSIGSDGLPLKLLRCGHVFDDTCWKEWISHGGNNVLTCPICKQDLGERDDEQQQVDQGRGSILRQRVERERLVEQPQQEPEVDYNRERNFRLARMAVRYPRYIRPAQIQRWSADDYQGSLIRDESFVRSDPSLRTTTSTSNGNMGRGGVGGSSRTMSFGGGMSAGGRGGRW